MNKLILFTILALLSGCFFDSEDYPPLPDLVEEDLYGCWLTHNSEEDCTKLCFDQSEYLYKIVADKNAISGIDKRSWEMLGKFKINGGGGMEKKELLLLMKREMKIV